MCLPEPELNIIFKFIPMIVCSCKAKSDRDINAVIDSGARTVDQVADRCGAGSGCGACRRYICKMLERKQAHCTSCECQSRPQQLGREQAA